jgi:hypothetical protein
MQADPNVHADCLALAEGLRRELLVDVEREQGLNFDLSFFKIAIGRPPTADEGVFYEGPHLDSHPGLSDSVELLRLLVNLSECPRRFVYAATDRWQLQRAGVPVARREFEPLRLPRATELRSVSIPGRTDDSVHALKFFASAVPHVGLNDAPEHFLVSFEALADPRAIRIEPEVKTA